MHLAHMTWRDVDAKLATPCCIMVPVGSTEQHGPMGYIGTDTICAEAVALQAAAGCNAIVAPPLAYTPAPFNTGFPGTISVSEETFQALATEVFQGLLDQGFAGIYVVNGHGANLAPLQQIKAALPKGRLSISSWWDPEPVQTLRRALFGDWEGMHATPSEISITQTLLGSLPAQDATDPPEQLSRAFIEAHKGDKHGPPDEHRARFPDGRVGSHSALASPEKGKDLLAAAATALRHDFETFERGFGPSAKAP